MYKASNPRGFTMATKSTPSAAAKSRSSATVPMSQMATELAEKREMPKKEVAGLFNEFVQLTVKHLKKGNKVRISGLGVLEVRRRAARMGRDPATGQAVKIKASKKIAFRVAKDLTEELGAISDSRPLRIDPLVKRVAALVGNEDRAIAWFNYQPIPAFGGKTARELRPTIAVTPCPCISTL